MLLDQSIPVVAYELSITILLAALHLYEQQGDREGVHHRAKRSSKYWPWGIATHEDGRHVVEGIIRAVRGLEGQGRTIPDLHHILPSNAEYIMRARGSGSFTPWNGMEAPSLGSSPPWNVEMRGFARQVTFLGVKCWASLIDLVHPLSISPLEADEDDVAVLDWLFGNSEESSDDGSDSDIAFPEWLFEAPEISDDSSDDRSNACSDSECGCSASGQEEPSPEPEIPDEHLSTEAELPETTPHIIPQEVLDHFKAGIQAIIQSAAAATAREQELMQSEATAKARVQELELEVELLRSSARTSDLAVEDAGQREGEQLGEPQEELDMHRQDLALSTAVQTARRISATDDLEIDCTDHDLPDGMDLLDMKAQASSSKDNIQEEYDLLAQHVLAFPPKAHIR